MKSKLRSILASLLIATLSLGSLAACNTGSTPAQSSSPAESSSVQSESESPDDNDEADAPRVFEGDNLTISINMQAGDGAKEAWEAVAEAYMKIHPEVKVVVDLKPEEGYGEWAQNIFSADNPTADILAINMAGSSAVDKRINFLEYTGMDSPYSDGLWVDQFNYNMQVRDLARNELTAISLGSVQVLWLYNKDIFAEVGVTPPTTWDEFIEVCDKLMAAGYQPLSVPGDFNSFWAGEMGWLAQVYTDQTTRSMINTTRAQEGDFCYDPDVDGAWTYDAADPYNDDTWKVNSNAVRAWKAINENVLNPDSPGMKAVWENFAQIFPKYAGGDAFFGTKDKLPLFYQGKAAMMVDGAWGLMQYENNMAKVAAGEEVTVGENKIEGITKFDLGTFNMPTMQGEEFEAPARTIEVAVGFLGAVKKDKAHDDMVVDFVMFLSSIEGYSAYFAAGVKAGMNVNGPSLVYGVELPDDIAAMFEGLSFIGNCQKGHGAILARGIGEIQESYRAFYDYSYSYLAGKSTIDDWLAGHRKNIEDFKGAAMTVNGISEKDLENPQTAPTGQ